VVRRLARAGIDEDWSEAAQRKTIAQAFESYGKRGTVEGLQQALQLFAGVHAVIEEPILNSHGGRCR